MEPLPELRRLIERHVDHPERLAALPDVTLMASSTPTDPLGVICETALAVVVQGSKRTVLADTVFDYGAGQYLVVPVELPLTAHIVHATPDEPFLAFGLSLRPAAVAELLLAQPADRARGRGTARITLTDAPTDLLDPIVRLLRLVDRPADIPVLGGAIQREILWRLLNGEQAEMVRQIGLTDSRLAQIAKAAKWIRAHYADQLRVEDLARTAAMSVTSFHRHFRAITTMSPIQYQKRIRLQEARARLVAEPDDVAAVGHAVGYDSASQFSREYRRFFGEPPGRDAARLHRARATSESWRI
ncbi:AraC family transcriptional regulator [Umezawaea sp.]|uniref:AraC family transcriptional regulator n=1 Tax=Umezawaea sp. TaxID=1955258 RepID=UPI002ED18991